MGSDFESPPDIPGPLELAPSDMDGLAAKAREK